MSNASLLVTGASGQLGRRVIEILLERGEGPIVATTRTPEKLADLAARGVDVRRADFDDDASLREAFRGVGRALLVSTDALDRPGRRREQHERAVAALEAAGVSHVVYTSLPNAPTSSIAIAPDHHATEVALAGSRLDYTVLRNNFYADLLLQALPNAVASGKLVDARPTGKVAYVTREDCARAAAAALADRKATGRRVLDVTGPAPVGSDELAAILADVTGKTIAHVAVPVDAFVSGLVDHGVPRPFAVLLGSFDTGIEKGDLASATDVVAQLTGTAPESVRDFLGRNRAALGA